MTHTREVGDDSREGQGSQRCGSSKGEIPSPETARVCTFGNSASLAPDLNFSYGKSIADQLSWGYCMQTLRSITKENSFVLLQLLTASDLAASDLKGFQPQVSSTDPLMKFERAKCSIVWS